MIFISAKKSYILDHELVPKHEILSDEEVDALLKQYNVSLNQLPKILDKDPVVKLIGAKVGQVLKITRKSPTAGEAVYYRLVVSSDLVADLEVEEASGESSSDTIEESS